MASFQARQRDPLFDSNTQALIERRGKELLGFALLLTAVLLGAVLATYHPEDPSWLSATDKPARNALGRFGASLASPLMVIIGMGAWSISLILAVWGVRFIVHVGEARAAGRLIFAPIAVALASVYASTHVPGAGWGHSFGLGGLFGDTILGAALGVVPVKAALGLKILAPFLAAGMLVMGGFVLGLTGAELRRIGRFLLLGMVMLYAAAMHLLGRGADSAVSGARRVLARRAARRRDRQASDPGTPATAPSAGAGLRRGQPLLRRPATDAAVAATASEPPVSQAGQDDFALSAGDTLRPGPEEPDSPGILARIPSIFRRRTKADAAGAAPEPDRRPPESNAVGNPEISAKIAQIIRNRASQQTLRHQPATLRPEPPLRPPQPRAPQGSGAAVSGAAPMPEAAPPPPGAAPGAAVPPVSGDARRVVQHPPQTPARPSRRARAEEQPALPLEDADSGYELPPLSLLSGPAATTRHQLSDDALAQNARMLENVLDDYGVKGEIVSVRPGPVVTMYELEPAPGLKASRVIGLADDIARSMSALSARVSTVPGRSVIGIELPNEHREKVMLREILSTRDFGDSSMKLPLALGKDIGGAPVVASLARMPHLLIAGTTGSGKSVAINTMILSLLYKLTPEECRLIMIDPKMLELSVYDGIPHLLSPVVTDPKKAVVALKWVVGEMEERYRKMSKMGVRNIEGYNGRVAEALARGEMFSRTVQTGFDDETGEPVFETEEFAPEKLPYIVVIVDEMADLMMVAGKEIEACIQRLAQMARASGIHLIMATQRPSVDVITGTIKANFPTRISFQVTSKVDSRTILGEQGAEQLLGMGDMLYMAGGARITRVHGPFVSDEEVEEVVNHLKAFGPPDYVSGVVAGPDEERESDIDLVLGLGGNTGAEDALYDRAVAIVARDRKCSTSYIQRKLAIGYNKAARLVEQMEEQGLVSPANHVGKREILIPEEP